VIIDPELVNPHQEPCLRCGEETAIGSVFFSDRREAELPDGTRGYLCSECVRELRRHHGDAFSASQQVEGSVIALAQFSQ
jgi:DNA-directed RNA polymerase subunit RPC12/RpoP